MYAVVVGEQSLSGPVGYKTTRNQVFLTRWLRKKGNKHRIEKLDDGHMEQEVSGFIIPGRVTGTAIAVESDPSELRQGCIALSPSAGFSRVGRWAGRWEVPSAAERCTGAEQAGFTDLCCPVQIRADLSTHPVQCCTPLEDVPPSAANLGLGVNRRWRGARSLSSIIPVSLSPGSVHRAPVFPRIHLVPDKFCLVGVPSKLLVKDHLWQLAIFGICHGCLA